MRKKLSFLGAIVIMVISFAVANAAPVSAATRLVSGVGTYDDAVHPRCPSPPRGYEDYVSYRPLVMTGSLRGCWYTKVLWFKDFGQPSGLYVERGKEIFVGRLDGGAEGSFTTNYLFEGQFSPDAATGVELRGQCQHPIVAGSGKGGLRGATGRIDFKDNIPDPPGSVPNPTANYRGHISL